MDFFGGWDHCVTAYFFVLPMWHFYNFLPLWHHFQPHVTLKIPPCDIHFHRHFYGGDVQFIFCTPVTSYFGLSVILWHAFFNPCDRGHNLLILDPCDHFTRYWPLWQSIFAYFYPCDKYVVTSPPARLLNGKAQYISNISLLLRGLLSSTHFSFYKTSAFVVKPEYF